MSLEQANFKYNAARHLLQVTYPLVKDPKLLLGVVSNLFQAYDLALTQLLQRERELLRIPPYTDQFQSKLNVYRHRIAKLHHLPDTHAQLISTLNHILTLHKESLIEFQRGDKFIICDDNYHIKAISAGDLKKYLTTTQQFLDFVTKTLNPK